MRFLTGLSLQQRIGLLVFLGLTLGLGMFSWLGIQSMNDSTQRALEERLTIARIVANHLDETLKHTLVQLENEANYEGGWPSETYFQQRAKALGTLLAKAGIVTQGVFLLDSEGRILRVEPDRPEAIGLALPGYEDIKGSLDQGLPHISSLLDAPVTGVPVAFATVPILDAAGRRTGALSVAIDVNQSSISGFIKPLTLGDTGYTEIIDKNGVVLARTEPGRPPAAFERSDHPGRFAQLMAEGKATVGTCHRCHGTESQPQRRRDVLAFAPLSTSPWGVAIRQSEEEAFALTEQLKRRLLILGGIVVVGVFLLIWVVMQGVVRPIKGLTATAARVAAGDFQAVAPLRRRDEIGQLSQAFAAMTRDLARVQRELLTRNQELMALNSIATTVSQSLDLEVVLARALQKFMEVTETEAGCVFLGDAEGKKLKLVASLGASRLFHCSQSGSAEVGCACHQVLRLGYTLMVNDVSQCPVLGSEGGTPGSALRFVSVPLKAKEKALGVMNLACSAEGSFTEEDFRLLDSIGRQVGLAVENSTLYQAARQHEELRGQLLTALISAQEDERKRVSRELHDGAGQTLTGLIMSIELAESMVPLQEKALHEKLAQARVIAVRLLGDMRGLMQDLRSTVMDDLGLVAAIRSYVQTNLEEAGILVDLEAEGPAQRLSPAVETALFRITQEAMHNIIKHAGARSARIRLKVEDSRVRLAIEDDGRGFDVAAFFNSDRAQQSQGLVGMGERATLLGGTFKVSSVPGQGTHIVVEIPLENSSRRGGDN